MGAGGLFLGADSGGGLQAVQERHLHVHEHRIKALLRHGSHGGLAVADDDDRVALLLKQTDGQPLVDRVVFGQQNAPDGRRLSRRVWRVTSGTGRGG